MKNILCFIYDTFADFEISFICSGIGGTDEYKVIYIAYEKAAVKSISGLTVIPDQTVSEALELDDIEGILIPGGVERILKPELEKLIKKLNKENKLIAAICAGPEFLAKMGLLNEIKYTTSEEPKLYEERNEIDPFPRENFVDTRLIGVNNILTAKGHAFIDFALEIWEWYELYEYESEREETKLLFTPI
jgi:putative intracellular protease/amidase